VISSTIKGNILEDLVATMHEMPGVLVEKRKKFRVVRGNSKRNREIDVLITSHVAGYERGNGVNKSAKVVPTSHPFELQPCQPCIEPARGDQRGVGALFDDAALIHHHDPVAGQNRCEPMGDHQRGAVAHQFL
jgi:hypothetical protein